jgi:undecaprenyl-diphosphatase
MNNTVFFFFYNFAHHYTFFDKIIVFTADIFPYIVILLAGLFLLFYYKIISSGFSLKVKQKWQAIFSVFFVGAFSWCIAEIIKILIHSPRPFIALSNVWSLFSETGYAFPSQHATFFASISMMIFAINKKVGYVFLIFTLLIGIARITAGVHFPVDIIGGFLLGTIIAVVFSLIFKYNAINETN